MVKPIPPSKAPHDAAESYAVGYKKPPAGSRFRKGQSGNARGRPKGTLNLATLVSQALSAKVVVTEGGRRRTKSKLEVSITQVANKAAGGDLKATQMLLNLMPLLAPAETDTASLPELKAGRELAQRIAARLARQVANAPKESDHD